MGFHSTLYFWLMLTGRNTPGIERIRQWFHHPNEGMVVIVSSLISLFVSRMLSLGIDTWTHLLLASMQWFWRLYLLITLYSGTSIMVSTTAGALYASGTSSWCSFHVSSTSEVVVAVFFLHHQQEGGRHLRYYLLCWKLQCRQQSKSGDERGWCWGSAPLLWPPALFHFPLPG